MIAANYTEDVIWSDPEATTHGHEALNERAQKLLDDMPDFVFNAAVPIHVTRDLGRFPFNLGVPQQPPAISGYDVAQVRDGRIAVLYTLGLDDRAAGADVTRGPATAVLSRLSQTNATRAVTPMRSRSSANRSMGRS